MSRYILEHTTECQNGTIITNNLGRRKPSSILQSIGVLGVLQSSPVELYSTNLFASGTYLHLEAEMTFLPWSAEISKCQVQTNSAIHPIYTIQLVPVWFDSISNPPIQIQDIEQSPQTTTLASSSEAMAPPRQRTTAIMDDSRSEASSGTREYPKPKSRRPAKDKAPVTSAPVEQDDQPRVRENFWKCSPMM